MYICSKKQRNMNPPVEILGHIMSYLFSNEEYYVACAGKLFVYASLVYGKKNYIGIIEQASVIGSSYLVKYIMQIKNPDVKTIYTCLIRACQNGHLDIVAFLLKHCFTNIGWQHDSRFTFEVTRFGEIRESLYRKKGGTILDWIEDMFHVSCINGQLKIAQFLHNVERNINYDLERILRDVGYSGHLHIMKWLFEIFPTLRYSVWRKCVFAIQSILTRVTACIFDSPTNFNPITSAFRSACLNGHLEMAKFLKKQGADEGVTGGSIFFAVCNNNKKEIAQWLLDGKLGNVPRIRRTFEQTFQDIAI